MVTYIAERMRSSHRVHIGRGKLLSALIGSTLGLVFLVPIAVAGNLGLDSPDFLPNDTQFSPWAYPLRYLQAASTTNSYAWTMYCVNVNYYAYIDPARGVIARRDIDVPMDRDVTQFAFHEMDTNPETARIAVLYGVGDWGADKLRTLLPNNGRSAEIEKGRIGGKWEGLQSHAKVFQADNGSNLYVSVHGSVNLQTVELTCKANTAVRFVESSPKLYSYFTGLSQAVKSSDGSGKFPGGRGTRNSSGTDLPPVVVGSYRVRFYAGRGDEFDGGSFKAAAKPWPEYINPPMPREHAKGIVSWYDQVIFDAARQLRQGRDVTIDIANFEVAGDAPFVQNLWRFVEGGFDGLRTEEKTSHERVPRRYVGSLTVRVLWQYLSDKGSSKSKSYDALYRRASITRTDKETGSRYQLISKQIWPAKGSKGPTTPYDMHNKLVILDVKGHEEARKLYLASSNFDHAGHGSGALWQVATTIEADAGTSIWCCGNTSGPSLWNSYKKYYDMLWESRQGGPNEGQVAFYQSIAPLHLKRELNWIETVPRGAFDSSNAPKPGIDAFFFPIPLSAN